jgi:hypothetical protein
VTRIKLEAGIMRRIKEVAFLDFMAPRDAPAARPAPPLAKPEVHE